VQAWGGKVELAEDLAERDTWGQVWEPTLGRSLSVVADLTSDDYTVMVSLPVAESEGACERSERDEFGREHCSIDLARCHRSLYSNGS
jgi:hypothetical protein